jgi:hypothetical protein
MSTWSRNYFNVSSSSTNLRITESPIAVTNRIGQFDRHLCHELQRYKNMTNDNLKAKREKRFLRFTKKED